MMENVLVSICLITYNHGSYIRKALESIIAQEKNFTWELIIADDYSTDNTRSIIEEYKLQYPDHINLIFQKTNVGPYQNWMDLLLAAKGKYISYIEGDDYWLDSKKLRRQAEFLENNKNYIACCGNAVYVKNNIETETVRNWPSNMDITTKDLLYGNDIISATFFFRNDLPENLPGIMRNIYAGDWMFYYLLSKKGNIYFMPEIIAAYRVHDNGRWTHMSYKRQIKRERELKMVLLRDNLGGENFFLLMREVIKLDKTLFLFNFKSVLKKLLGDNIFRFFKKNMAR